MVLSLCLSLNVCYSRVLICVCYVRAGDGVSLTVPGVACHVLIPKEAEYQQADAEISAKGEEESKSQR